MMRTKVDLRLCDLAWPPTHAYFVHRLHRAVRDLIDQIDQYDQWGKCSGSGANEAMYDAWFIVHRIGTLLDLSSLIQEHDSTPGADRGEAERRLDEAMDWAWPVDPNVVPNEFREHLDAWRRPEFVGAFQEILRLLPDPFDGPNGGSIALFEWARHHLGTTPRDWDFDAKLSSDFRRRWRGAQFESVEVQREVLIVARFLRSLERGGS